MRRAAPEIYKSIRAEGTSSCRQWLKDNFSAYKGSGGQWPDLWSMASQVDLGLQNCSSDQEILDRLMSDDRLEVALRHLGAYFYEQRTRDRTGAAQMRAFATPGSTRDIMPSWALAEATTYSKSEFQRSERVESELKRRTRETAPTDGAEKAAYQKPGQKPGGYTKPKPG